MMNKHERILSVLRKHPNEWMSAGQIAKHDGCNRWATARAVSNILTGNTVFPGVECRNITNASYQLMNEYRYNPEAA